MNMGIQLKILENMGFDHLYGIDVSEYALSKGRKQYSTVNLIERSTRPPFEDDCFDLMFTIGILVTIPPEYVETAIDEIVRCSNRYVWDSLLWHGEYRYLYSHWFQS
jgi:ubiquinone/menaquinone biosynthesis C-methylase UbiE